MSGVSPIVTRGFIFTPDLVVTAGYMAGVAFVGKLYMTSSMTDKNLITTGVATRTSDIGAASVTNSDTATMGHNSTKVTRLTSTNPMTSEMV